MQSSEIQIIEADLSHRYTLVEAVGNGQFGQVYRGFASSDNSIIVAVKRIQLKNMQEGVQVYMRNEAQILNSISKHPNVIEIYEHLEVNDCIYIIMPLLISEQQFDTFINLNRNPAKVSSLLDKGITYKTRKALTGILEPDKNKRMGWDQFYAIFSKKPRIELLPSSNSSLTNPVIGYSPSPNRPTIQLPNDSISIEQQYLEEESKSADVKKPLLVTRQSLNIEEQRNSRKKTQIMPIEVGKIIEDVRADSDTIFDPLQNVRKNRDRYLQLHRISQLLGQIKGSSLRQVIKSETSLFSDEVKYFYKLSLKMRLVVQVECQQLTQQIKKSQELVQLQRRIDREVKIMQIEFGESYWGYKLMMKLPCWQSLLPSPNVSKRLVKRLVERLIFLDEAIPERDTQCQRIRMAIIEILGYYHDQKYIIQRGMNNIITDDQMMSILVLNDMGFDLSFYDFSIRSQT